MGGQWVAAFCVGMEVWQHGAHQQRSGTGRAMGGNEEAKGAAVDQVRLGVGCACCG